MMKPAFSTLACPHWTLDQVAERAAALGFEAVELRTFGDASAMSACDPALTAGDKVRRLFGAKGVEVLSLATSVRFDEPVYPPVIGYAISDTERSTREGQRAVDIALGIECPFVRVFGFEFPAREKRSRAITRIVGRLGRVLDHADKTGVRIVIENGGSFSSVDELAELLAACPSPLLGVSYNIAVARAAGDNLDRALALLGDRLWVARIKDHRAGRPCLPGDGEVPCERFVQALRNDGFDGPLVFEWDRAWVPDLAPPEEVLPAVSARLWSWLGGRVPAANGATQPASAGRAPAAAHARR